MQVVNFVSHLSHIQSGYLFLGWTSTDTSAVVFQEVLWTFLDTGGSVGILSLRIPFPLVLDRVVYLHGRALLLAHTVVVKILAGLE